MKITSNHLYKYYHNLPTPAKASLWFIICSVLQKGISFITTPIFTRIMSPNDFGVLTIYLSWYTIISILATLNLYAGVYNNGLLKYQHDRNNFRQSMIGLSQTITLALFLIYLIFKDTFIQLLELNNIYIYAMFFELLFAPTLSFWMVEQRFDYKYKSTSIVILTSALLSPIITIIGFYFFPTNKAEVRVFVFVAVQVIIGIVLYLYFLHNSKKFFNKKYWLFALKFNLPLIPHYLSMTILQQSDRIMIAKYVGIDKAAIYGVAFAVGSIMSLLINSINSSLIPFIYKSLKNEEENRIKEITTGIYISICLFILLSIIVAPELLTLFAPPAYQEALWIIPPVSLSIIFLFLYNLYGTIEFYQEKTFYVMSISLICALLNILLNYYCIPIYGYISAGYTTLFCNILFAILHYGAYKKVWKGENLFQNKLIWTISLALIAIAILILAIYIHTLIRYLLFVTICSLLIIKRKKMIDYLKMIKNA